MKKILWLTNIPSPYRVAFFNELGKQCSLMVLFEKASSDVRDDDWKNYSFDTFEGIILKGIATSVNTAISLQFAKYINSYKDDIIVVGNPATPTGLLAILYMQMRNIPYVVESDGAFPSNSQSLKEWLKKRLYSKAKACFTTSKLGVDYFLKYSVKRKNIYIYPFSSVPNFYLTKKPLTKTEKKELRKNLNIVGKKIIVSVGQFVYRKGFDVLLEALCQVDTDVHTYIIGNKPTQSYIDYCKKHNLDNVHFIEFMRPEQLKLWYQAADFFVLPTREDVWGLVVNEAMACALPVITTTRCMAGLEMVENGKNGYLVEVGNSEYLAKAINKMSQMDDIDNMALDALKKAREYTIETMAQKHVELFNILN